MLLNIIMAVCIYPVLIFMYVILKRNGKPQKGRYFSVSFKSEWLEDEKTKKVLEETNRQYEKELKYAFWISVIVPVICFVIPYISIQVTIWTVWIFAAVVIFYVPFPRANGRVRRWKEEQGWATQVNREVYIELKSLGQVRRVKLLHFTGPFIITLLTIVSGVMFRMSGTASQINSTHEMVFYVFWITFLLSIALFAVCAIWLDKKPTEVISLDSDVNLNYTRAKKNAWKGFWEQVAWATAMMQVMTAIILWNEQLFMSYVLWGSIAYSVVVMVLVLILAGKLIRIEKNYEDKKSVELYIDDDKYWIGGLFYYNPNDKRSMVETRVGMGTTMNMATALGKGLYIFCVATIVLCVGLCGWVILEEFTPISLSAVMVTEQESKEGEICILAEHLGVEYEIMLDDITQITYLEELPAMSKTVGSAMEHMYKGKFFVSEEGRKCNVFLNPQNEIFLRIEVGETIYYISGVDDEQTQEVYDLIIHTRDEGGRQDG